MNMIKVGKVESYGPDNIWTQSDEARGKKLESFGVRTTAKITNRPVFVLFFEDGKQIEIETNEEWLHRQVELKKIK